MSYSVKPAQFGSVSTGTMRNVDLLSTFASELSYQLKRQVCRFPRKAMRKLIHEANRMVERLVTDDSDDAESEASDIVAELFDTLGTFAPDYGYFGSHAGDGADYGYWLSDNAVEDFDGLKVSDLSDIPADYRGEVMVINDHGNVTLGVAMPRGKFRTIWAIV